MPLGAVADPLDDLSRDFWAWRATTQPSSGDDIPRIERPDGWLPDWSPAAIAARRTALDGFERRYRAIDPAGWSVPRQVDHRLVGSALARVRWELDGAAAWRRDPAFYIQQALGPVFDVLLPPPPVSAARADLIIARLGHAARTLEHARANLDDTRAPFARLAIDTLKDIDQRLATVAAELDAAVPSHAGRFSAPAAAAARRPRGLPSLARWTRSRRCRPRPPSVARPTRASCARWPSCPSRPRNCWRWAGRSGSAPWPSRRSSRAATGRCRRCRSSPISRRRSSPSALQEQAIRAFLEREQLLTVPAWMQHYLNLPLPAYLAPLAFLGVTDDLTSATRLKENGLSYIRVPSPSLPYFYLSTARDPRPIIVHEGVPGHYMQLALAWAHENPDPPSGTYDSGAQEGIGFYAEEMMLQAGLWAESPRSREIIYNFARLRALRVEVDVRLATGTFTIPQAAEYLEKTVPMDRETALEEAASFAAGPGQAITYQIGKLQILAHARRRPPRPGRRLLAARLPRCGVEERQRAPVAAALGAGRRPERGGPPGDHPLTAHGYFSAAP